MFAGARPSVRPFVLSLVCSCVFPYVSLFGRSFVRSSVRSIVRSIVRSTVRPSVPPFVRSFVCLFVRPSLRPSFRSFVRYKFQSLIFAPLCSSGGNTVHIAYAGVRFNLVRVHNPIFQFHSFVVTGVFCFLTRALDHRGHGLDKGFSCCAIFSFDRKLHRYVYGCIT